MKLVKNYQLYLLGLKDEVKKILEDNRDSRLFNVKLTIKNVNSDNLSASILLLNEAFPKFLKSSGLNDLTIGYAKDIITSFNSERKDYNVYIDCLLILPSSYFDNRREHKDLVELWRKALRIPYTPFLSFFATRKGDNSSYIGACLNEIDLFIARLEKCYDSLDDAQELAMYGRKLLTFGGVLN